MSATRALPTGLDTDNELATTVADNCRARRALGGTEPPVLGGARRALVEPDVLLLDDALPMRAPAAAGSSNQPQATRAARAFAAPPRRRFTGNRLVATLGLVLAVSSLSGAAVAGSSALSAAPAVVVPEQAIDRQAPVSRNAERLAPTSVAPITPAEATTPTTAESTEVADAATSEPQDAPAQADPVAEVVPATPEFGIDTTIAAGQLSPATVAEAMARAEQMTGNWGYQNMCLSLVAAFYGYSSAGEVGAQQAANTIIAAGQMHTDLSDIPVGALIWYDGTPIGNPYGHVAMYAGNGMVYSNGAPTGVGLIPLHEPADGWGEPIIGWSSVWLPAATG